MKYHNILTLHLISGIEKGQAKLNQSSPFSGDQNMLAHYKYRALFTNGSLNQWNSTFPLGNISHDTQKTFFFFFWQGVKKSRICRETQLLNYMVLCVVVYVVVYFLHCACCCNIYVYLLSCVS